jgi:hypothetical protein
MDGRLLILGGAALAVAYLLYRGSGPPRAPALPPAFVGAPRPLGARDGRSGPPATSIAPFNPYTDPRTRGFIATENNVGAAGLKAAGVPAPIANKVANVQLLGRAANFVEAPVINLATSSWHTVSSWF